MSQWKITGADFDANIRAVYTVTKGTRRLDHRELNELEALLDPWAPISTAPKDRPIILRRGDYVATGSWLQCSPTRPVWKESTGEYLGEAHQKDNSHWVGYGFSADEPPTSWMPL